MRRLLLLSLNGLSMNFVFWKKSFQELRHDPALIEFASTESLRALRASRSPATLHALVDQITDMSLKLVFDVWEHMEFVILQVVDCYCSFHPPLQGEARRVAQDLVVEKKNDCEKHVRETIEMEKLVGTTLSP